MLPMPHFSRILAVAVLAALPILESRAQLPAGMSPPTAERLAARIDSVVRTDILPRGFPSVSIVIARGGQPLLERAWGVANLGTGQKATPATTYRIGSVAKQFTAALVLKLVDRGTISLTDSIARHLPGLPSEWSAITIEQLLNHTSGLGGDFRDVTRVAERLPTDSLVAMAARSGLRSAPGAMFVYSNTGYMLLGALIEKLHGKSYAGVLREEIARPLGLTALRYCDDAAGDRGAAGYTRTSVGSVVPPVEQHPSQGLGADAICATAGDLARWNHALHNGRVLSPAAYTAMTTPRGAAAGRYGFGLVPRKAPWGSPSIVHGGESAGLAAHNGWFPAESLSVTVLYNALPRPEVDMAEFIGTIALGGTPRAMPPMPRVELPVAATQGEGRPRFVGAYDLRAGAVFIVTFENGKPYVTPPNGDPQELFLKSGMTYSMGSPDGSTIITFTTGPDGAVTGFTARADGVDRHLRKIK